MEILRFIGEDRHPSADRINRKEAPSRKSDISAR